MNDIGNQPQFAGGGLFVSNNTLKEKLQDAKVRRNTQMPVIKTYVTATDMSNQQQFDRTIKTRSLL